MLKKYESEPTSPKGPDLTRRQFLKFSGLTLFTFLLSNRIPVLELPTTKSSPTDDISDPENLGNELFDVESSHASKPPDELASSPEVVWPFCHITTRRIGVWQKGDLDGCASVGGVVKGLCKRKPTSYIKPGTVVYLGKNRYFGPIPYRTIRFVPGGHPYYAIFGIRGFRKVRGPICAFK